MIFRLAVVEDIPRLISILEQVNLIHHLGRPDLFKKATKYTPSELEEIIADKNRPIFVAADDNNIVQGYIFGIVQQILADNILTDVKTLYIDDMCIDENCRGGHVGTKLYEYVSDYARKEGFYRITLNVWAINAGAREFYDTLGLKPLKTYMEHIL